MNVKKENLLDEFGAYVKASIKRTRQKYLEKMARIRSYEMIICEEEWPEEAEEEDILLQVDAASKNIEREVMDVQILLDQISNSRLFQALLGLTKRQKEILLLRIVYTKSFAEIGNMLGMPPKRVESTYYNLIRKMRKAMGGTRDGI